MFVCAYSQFFKKRGVVGIEDEYQLFNQVTGLNLCGHGEEFLSQVIILVASVLPLGSLSLKCFLCCKVYT